MEDKSSRGEQLYEQTQKQRLRLVRTGFVLQVTGFLLPIITGILFGVEWELSISQKASDLLFSITFIFGGLILIVGSFMISELREPKLPVNKYRAVKQFHGAYRRKGQVPMGMGFIIFLYGLYQLIGTLRG